MRKGRLLAFLLLLAALAGLIWLTFRGPSEPMYEGKPLSFWLEGYDPATRTETSQQQADHAMEAIGTNAIPTLLEMVRMVDSPSKREFVEWARIHPMLHIRFREGYQERSRAIWGFKALGANGKSAVPELIRLLGATNGPVGASAAACLGEIGPASEPAVSALLKMVKVGNSPDAVIATYSLGKIHAKSEAVVPALITGLASSNYRLRLEAITVLGEFGTDAKSAIPNLLPLLNDPDPFLGSQVTNAIQRIDPENAAKIFASAKSDSK
jgi:HEAT repeat protein